MLRSFHFAGIRPESRRGTVRLTPKKLPRCLE
jgi:hypothetical protein